MKIKAYAKINLTLNVLGKFDNGYHNLDMINLPLKLHDQIRIIEKPHFKETNVKTSVKEIKENNIVLTAVQTLRSKYHFENHFLIKIKKNIPLLSGLGGGSADAAATLRGLFQLLNVQLSHKKQIEIATLIGADVPFCLFNQPARVQGLGEKLNFFSFKKQYSVLIVKPQEGLTTKEVYENLDLQTLKTHNLDQIISALEEGNLNLLDKLIGNNLEKPAISLLEEIQTIKNLMIQDGLKNVLMSGAGSAVFSLDERKKHSRLAKKYKKLGYNVIITKTL
ncbi:MAG: 4-(cytidine 5'-diphospho)-2-C-methyl-D-erythritol kinase [Bacilli bacterium]|jgi:4-diphosphocytidyl-2C-methyl-D-erythritol kinase|nr:4-(cytidine 5'-diphospho)-2-C-methyl-D-erythritol kinase [Bacilli bacterium]